MLPRWASILGTVAVVGTMGYLAFEQLSKPIPHVLGDDAGAGDDAGVGPTDASAEAAALSDPAEAGALDTDGGLTLGIQLDAGALANLGSTAPRSVKLGVVLVQFAGAEGATSQRSKADALKRAHELQEQAKTDFSGAVKAGDQGSAADIGRIPRGVLEQPTEVAVFSLAAGELSEPLETPRGYWVVKRLE